MTLPTPRVVLRYRPGTGRVDGSRARLTEDLDRLSGHSGEEQARLGLELDLGGLTRVDSLEVGGGDASRELDLVPAVETPDPRGIFLGRGTRLLTEDVANAGSLGVGSGRSRSVNGGHRIDLFSVYPETAGGGPEPVAAPTLGLYPTDLRKYTNKSPKKFRCLAYPRNIITPRV